MNQSTNTPTVVLVHGGFADASFWAPVIKELQAHGHPGARTAEPAAGIWPTTLTTSRASSTRSTARCSWSATPTVER